MRPHIVVKRQHHFIKRCVTMVFNKKEGLQSQTFLGLHDLFDNTFRHGFTSR